MIVASYCKVLFIQIIPTQTDEVIVNFYIYYRGIEYNQMRVGQNV